MKGLSQLACPFTFAFQRSMKGLSQLASPFSFAFQPSVRKGHQAGLQGANPMSGFGCLNSIPANVSWHLSASFESFWPFIQGLVLSL
jgi:hypothetical protein